MTHERSQKDNKSSNNTADGRPTCIYTSTNCTIVHSTADSARDKMPSNWTESSQFCMKILRNARRHNVLKVNPKWFTDQVGEHHTCTGESQVSIFNTLKIPKQNFSSMPRLETVWIKILSTYFINEKPHTQLIVPLKIQKSLKDFKFYRRRAIITSKNTRLHIQYCRLLIEIHTRNDSEGKYCKRFFTRLAFMWRTEAFKMPNSTANQCRRSQTVSIYHLWYINIANTLDEKVSMRSPWDFSYFHFSRPHA